MTERAASIERLNRYIQNKAQQLFAKISQISHLCV